MTRGVLSLAAAFLVAVGAVVALRIARSEEPPPTAADRPSELILVVVQTSAGPRAVVVGSGGSIAPAALLLPDRAVITIPGQGDGTMGDAGALPGRSAATAAANLLGVWIPHHVVLDERAVRQVVDRAGGLEIGGTGMTGAEAAASFEGSEQIWATTLEAILRQVRWEPEDLAVSDGPTRAAEILNGARGATVSSLPGDDLSGGFLRPDLDAIRTFVTALWGVPDREVLPLVVLNGSGEPGIGEGVAERVIGGGFRVVVSENATSFDHETTLVVVASEEDRALGERVRDLLGIGEVQVAGPASGIADVTVVVGKDFEV
ncbi:MAG TPA: LytR C-terminal domain-containing protein [Actinomycetota bacterium]|nr:LytR C-terminal domain-containing protein [Actinomycetota bacterium]